MEYQIINKPAFTVFGKCKRVSVKNAENLSKIPQFWRDSRGDGTLDQLTEIAKFSTAFPKSKIGAVTNPSADLLDFDYIIGAEAERDATVDGLVQLDVPSSVWAVFVASGPMPESIQALWKSIFSEFFPEGKYKQGVGPALEVYPPGNPSDSDYTFEVWIPVVAV